MKRKIVIVFLLVLMLCMSFCISGVVFADSIKNVNQYVYEFANEFVKNIDGGVIKDAIPIYDVDDNISSCCFKIYVEDEPYMYIILDNYYREETSPIIEMGFGDWFFNKDEKIVNLNYIDYGIKKNNVVEVNGQKIDNKNLKTQYSAYSVKNQYNILSNNTSVYAGYYSSLIGMNSTLKKLSAMSAFLDFEPFIQEDLLDSSLIGDGICGATTTMNALKYYSDAEGILEEVRDDPIAVYNILRNYQSEVSYNIISRTEIKNALTNYIKEYTSFKVSIGKFWINSWNNIYKDIDNGKLVYYEYGGDEGTHCVLAVAAASYDNGFDFIYVADTWNKSLRWLHYGYHKDIKCMSIKIYGY